MCDRHLKEDLQAVIGKNLDEMPTAEWQFHYFRVHDFNNDQTLGESVCCCSRHSGESYHHGACTKPNCYSRSPSATAC